ncbi:MAG: hypothetical protein ACTSU2_16385 [Promethearchaeota archaeon]
MSEEKFQEIIKLKDEEIAKLSKLKDVLKAKYTELKKENEELKNQNKDLLNQLQNLKNVATSKAGESNIVSQNNTSLNNNGNDNSSVNISNREILNFLQQFSSSVLENIGILDSKIADFMKKVESLNVVSSKLSINEVNKRTPSSFKTSKSPDNLEKKDTGFKFPKPSERLRQQNQAAGTEPDLAKPIDKVQSNKAETGSSPTQAPQNMSGVNSFSRASSSSSSKILQVKRTDGPIKCPKCGSMKFQEEENRARIIGFGMFGKKYHCKVCRTEWEYVD